MKKLYVYADFDWLKEIELVGELGYESLRGFDRTPEGHRIHFASAMTLLGLSDGDNARPGTAIWTWLISSFRIVPMWKPTCKSFTAGWLSMSASAIAMTISAITVFF